MGDPSSDVELESEPSVYDPDDTLEGCTFKAIAAIAAAAIFPFAFSILMYFGYIVTEFGVGGAGSIGTLLVIVLLALILVQGSRKLNAVKKAMIEASDRNLEAHDRLI